MIMPKLSLRLLAGGIMLTVGAMTAFVGADVIYVDDSATAGANNGESWPDAFTDLQSALAIANAGDEIRVGQGTYKPAPPGGDRTISFNLVSGTTLRGGYAGVGAIDPNANDPVAFETILSGDINNTTRLSSSCNLESHHVLATHGVAAGTSLTGCVIERGCALAVPDFDLRWGGGLLVDERSNLEIVDCVFRNNRARQGGGMYVAADSTVQVRRCGFVANRLQLGNCYGGGAYAGGAADFTECDFLDNYGPYGGGLRGSRDTRVVRCRFVGNSGEAGGAVYGVGLMEECLLLDNWGHFGGAAHNLVAIVNCQFLSNYASFAAGAARQFDLALNCLFIGNSVEGPGGAVVNGAMMVNCAFLGNRLTLDTSQGTAIAVIDSSTSLWNCIVWDNRDARGSSAAQPIWLHDSNIDIRNNSVQGWTGSLGGVGNHGNDPRFVDADGPDDIYGTADDDPRLRPNSPCIDSGDATQLPPDEFDLDDDGDVTEPLPIDLDGLPRVVGANLDMGAFEFQGIPCRADIDGDASVGIDDLLAVISGWGPCVPGEECNADLNLDSAVTVLDLQRVIDDWGACR